MRKLRLVVVALLLAVVAACGSGSEDNSNGSDRSDDTADEAEGAMTDDTDDTDTDDTDDTDAPTETMAPQAPPGTITTSPEVTDEDEVAELVEDVDGLVPLLNDFWSQQIPGYVPPDGPLVYISDEEPFPSCGGEEVGGDNAFFCFDDNFVAFAGDYFLEEQVRIGDTFTYVVLAHEWGHSAQGSFGDLRAENGELQADCYAGGFIQDALDNGLLEEEPGDAQEFNQSIATISNEFGSEEFHGTLAQRSTAFEFGRANGVEACRTTYASTGTLPPTTAPFTPTTTAPPQVPATTPAPG